MTHIWKHDTVALKDIAERVVLKFGHNIIDWHFAGDELVVEVILKELHNLLAFLKEDKSCLFEQMMDVTAVDYPAREARFDIVYNLLSMSHNQRIRIKSKVKEDEHVPTVTDLWLCANWWEREVWDMFGIIFDGHPDLRRILTDFGFEGHPLRKDFPFTGYVEVRYDETQKRVIYEPVQFAQEYRSSQSPSVWGEHMEQAMIDAQKKGDQE